LCLWPWNYELSTTTRPWLLDGVPSSCRWVGLMTVARIVSSEILLQGRPAYFLRVRRFFNWATIDTMCQWPNSIHLSLTRPCSSPSCGFLSPWQWRGCSSPRCGCSSPWRRWPPYSLTAGFAPSRPRTPAPVLVLSSLLHPLAFLPCLHGGKVDLIKWTPLWWDVSQLWNPPWSWCLSTTNYMLEV